MQALSLGRSNLAQTAVVSVLTLAAVALLGAVLAYWTWAWFAPRAEPRLEAAAAQSGSAASAGAIFGTVPRTRTAAAPTGIAIKLLGVVAAAGGRRGYAVVQLEGKQVLAVHEGEDVAPGVRLAEVLADHVILERSGMRETLALPERKGLGTAPAQAAGAPAAQAAASAAAQAAAQKVGKAAGRGKDDE
jgi:general secretion pathway protein C